MPAIKDLTSQKFGKLKVISRAENINGRVAWNCICECGKISIIRTGDLTSKNRIVSCGRCNDVNDDVIYEYENNYIVGYSKLNRKFLIDKEDLPKIKNFSICVSEKGYVTLYQSGKSYTLHRFLMKPSNNEVVDHINRKPYDNRKSNLRICKPIENTINRSLQGNNKTGVTGVMLIKRNSKYRAEITVNKKKMWLGEYNNIEDAMKVRKLYEEKYFGEFNPK